MASQQPAAPPVPPSAVSAALARLLAPLPVALAAASAPAPGAAAPYTVPPLPPAAAAPAPYTVLPLLSTLLQVDEALERRTAHGASAGTSGASCEGTLKFAEQHAHTTILRARGIVATFPALWTDWSEEGRLQRVLHAGSRPGL